MQNALPGISITQHVQLKYVFGMNPNIKNSLLFHDEERIIYPAGYNIVLYDLQDKSQHYYQGTNEYRGISCVCLSPLKRYLALGVKGQGNEKPGIILFDTFTQKRRKNLGFGQSPQLEYYNIKQWISVAFPNQNQETRYIYSLSGGGGDHILCWWWHEKGRCIGYYDLGIQNDIFDLQIGSIGNLDTNLITISGNKFFKCYVKSEEQLKDEKNTNQIQELQMQKNILNQVPEQYKNRQFIQHLWLSCDNLVLLVSLTGELLIFDSILNFIQVVDNSTENLNVVTACIFSKGFFVAFEAGIVLQYNIMQGEQEIFNCVLQYNVKKILDLKEKTEIKCMCINKGEDKLIFSLSNCQIHELKLKQNIEYVKQIHLVEDIDNNMITLPFHTGPIISMDICKRKPIIATLSTDRYIKIWDYEKKTIDIQWSFNQEVSCLSLHPQGFGIVVAFADKLKLMNLCIHNSTNNQKNKAYKEISPFKGCKEIKFSNGGQYFAAVNSSSSNQIIQVFQFFTGENPQHHIFKGHTGRVKCIAWSTDDSMLVSCGMDGMILAWKVDQDFQAQQPTVPRIVDIHCKGVNFYGITLSEDNKTIIAAGSDKNIHLVNIGDYPHADKTEKKMLDVNLSCLGFPSSNKLLFAGIQDDTRLCGALRCFIYPISHGKFTDYQAHDERGVEKIRITNDDKYIITVGRDGCMMFFEIKEKDIRQARMKDGYAKFSEEVLVSRADLDDLKNIKDNLQLQITEFSNQNAMLVITSRQEDIYMLDEQIKLNQIKRQNQIESLKKQKNQEEAKLINELNELQELAELEIQTMDTKYQKEVMSLVEQYENFKRLHEIENNKNNKKKSKLEQENNQKLIALDNEFQKQLEEQRTQKKRVEKQIQERQKQYAEAQDLEKFKFVLDHKIKELKRDIGPREEEIAKMKEQTNIMDAKLKELNTYNNFLGTVVDELYTAQETMKEEIKIQRQVMFEQQIKISRFKDDIYALAQYILDFNRLKKSDYQNKPDVYQYDEVFNIQMNQSLIFHQYFSNSINQLINGQNTAFLIHGPSNCGKSYIFSGEQERDDKGIIYQGCQKILQEIPEQEILLQICSIYQNQIFDLLSTHKPATNFQQFINMIKK
ncbi:WD repeat protein [Ichthyophthirius multifiliis]|uniref:WD repeat protein n=1 Tax=Ichthyophthirius multifiliis TaxID=5932 RepID=G0QNW3_ICHMU|nr:WD repeat protein [Ichthyophthirius multifiliis]EGR33091.1 WD repeat protein [Ichthyophthirius multifiliis]|eukprot:XP_004037077.1 WD repeat protein [Ichthyophthirius multifiliis]